MVSLPGNSEQIITDLNITSNPLCRSVWACWECIFGTQKIEATRDSVAFSEFLKDFVTNPMRSNKLRVMFPG